MIADLLGQGGPCKAVFDRDAALAFVEGDIDLLRRMAMLFLAACPDSLQQIGDAVLRGDTVALQRAAHKLKGSVSYFAAQTAAEAVARLEHIDLGKQAAAGAEAQTALEVAVGELQAALDQFVKEPLRCES